MTNEQTTVPGGIWYRYRRRWIFALGAICLMSLLLVSLPYGIQYGLVDFLKQHGARQVQIRNVDFNPFTGRLLFEEVSAESDSARPLRLTRLELVLGWRDLFSKRARIETVELQGLEAVVDLSDTAVLLVSGLSFPLGGGVEAPSPGPASDSRSWGFALDQIELLESVLTLQREQLVTELELERLSLQRLISWQMQEVADLSLEARVNGAPLTAELRARLFDPTREIEGEIDLKRFDLSALRPLLTAADGPKLEGGLSLQQAFRITLSSENRVSWESDGMLQGKELRVAAPQFESRHTATRWQGSSKGTWSGQAGLQLNLDGELRLDELSLRRHRLQADLSSLWWQGAVALATGETTLAMNAQGEGGLEGLHLSDGAADAPLAALQRLDLRGIDLSSANQLAIEDVGLRGIRLDLAANSKADPLLQNETLSLKDVRFNESSGLSIGLIEQQDIQARLSLDKAGKLNLLAVAERLQQAATPAEAGDDGNKAEKTETPPIKIERLVWQGSNQVAFTDNTVKPPYQISLAVSQLSLGKIDTSQPGRPSPFRFTGSSGRHAEIKAEGQITLFQSDPTGQLQGRLKGVELVPLSSYTVPAIGYRLDSGELDTEIELTLEQGLLKGNNHLIIRRLEVSRAGEEEAAKLEEQIAMPLDTALGMLQDKHQTIDLNLPVSGRLNDPNVELGEVINTALGNALKKGAMTYLTTALFPYGTMVALLKMAGEKATAVRLNPVEFEPAEVSLDDQDRDYLGKVAQVLKERPKIAVKLCAVATRADHRELALGKDAERKGESQRDEAPAEGVSEASASQEIPQAELLNLAKRRAELIEDFLVKQHNIDPSRTAVCRPLIDPDEEARPRVELQI